MSNEPPIYRVILEPDVLKSLRKLPKDLVRRLQSAIDALALNPRPQGYGPVKGRYNHFRIRVGKWRIIYMIQDEQLLIIVVDVGPRGVVYGEG